MRPLLAAPLLLMLLAPVYAADEPRSAQPPQRLTTPTGETAEIYTLANSHGLKARILTWGATLIEMDVPDRAGKLADVTLGFDDPARYFQPHPVFGCVVGRVANRIANARFTLDGREYKLAANSSPNHIHGGARGFDKHVWTASSPTDHSVCLTYISPDGEEGYPGQLTTSITYTLTDKDELRLDYQASTDKPTVVNLTNHTYWNLAGEGDILKETLQIHASRYTPTDSALIPSGEIAEVAGTPVDFRTPKPIGRDLEGVKAPKGPGGFDHNFLVEGNAGELRPAAEVRDPDSGRVMKVFTTEPAVQFYSAIHLDTVGKGGRHYTPFSALCLETQHFPDSPNHPNFPSITLRPGQELHSTTVYAFSTGG